MKTTDHTFTENRPRPAQSLGRKARLASLALGGCALLIAGCADREVATENTVDEDRILDRDVAVAPQPGLDVDARAGQPGADSNQAESKDSAAMVLNEEQLNLQKREVDAGGVLITKDVQTREVSQPVQLRQEQVDIQRLTPEEARERGIAMDQQGEKIDEGQVYIPLTREEAVVQKEVATTGVVQAETKAQTEQQDVDATLRREVVDVQRQAGEMDDPVVGARSQAGAGIEQRIRAELMNDQEIRLTPQQLNQLQIQSSGDGVRLSGTVPTEEIREAIYERVNDIDGISNVQNDLKVAQ